MLPYGNELYKLHLTLGKATQSTLLVSRPHPDENGCGREVIIHYSLFGIIIVATLRV